MRVIIAGTRDISPAAAGAAIIHAIDRSGLAGRVAEVVSGRCGGIDLAGEAWAKGRGIPVKPFPADWDTHGTAAGPLRNGRMAEYGDVLVALPRRDSRGTRDMIGQMRAAGKSVFVFELRAGYGRYGQ